MPLGIQVRLLISWHKYVRKCYEVYVYVTQWSTSWLEVYTTEHLALVCTRIPSSSVLNYKHMALVISMLNTIFPLYTKTRNHHLKYPNVLRLISS